MSSRLQAIREPTAKFAFNRWRKGQAPALPWRKLPGFGQRLDDLDRFREVAEFAPARQRAAMPVFSANRRY
jgi:hypothetical protein